MSRMALVMTLVAPPAGRRLWTLRRVLQGIRWRRVVACNRVRMPGDQDHPAPPRTPLNTRAPQARGSLRSRQCLLTPLAPLHPTVAHTICLLQGGDGTGRLTASGPLSATGPCNERGSTTRPAAPPSAWISCPVFNLIYDPISNSIFNRILDIQSNLKLAVREHVRHVGYAKYVGYIRYVVAGAKFGQEMDNKNGGYAVSRQTRSHRVAILLVMGFALSGK